MRVHWCSQCQWSYTVHIDALPWKELIKFLYWKMAILLSLCLAYLTGMTRTAIPFHLTTYIGPCEVLAYGCFETRLTRMSQVLMVPCDYAFLQRWRYDNLAFVRQYVCRLNGADFIFPIPFINLCSALSARGYFAIRLGLNGNCFLSGSSSKMKHRAIVSLFTSCYGVASDIGSRDKASATTFLVPLMCSYFGPYSSNRSLHLTNRSLDNFPCRMCIWSVCTTSRCPSRIFLNSFRVSTMDNNYCSPVV